MSAVAWIAVGSLISWVWLLLGQGFYWRTDQRLPRRTDPARWPSVAVVVPARDEAAMLPVSLPSLLVQDYPGRPGSSSSTTAAATAPGNWPGTWPPGTAVSR